MYLDMTIKHNPPKRFGGGDRGVWIDLATAAQKRRPVDMLNQNLDRSQEKDNKKSSFKQSWLHCANVCFVTVQFVVQLCAVSTRVCTFRRKLCNGAAVNKTLWGGVGGKTMDNLDDLRLWPTEYSWGSQPATKTQTKSRSGVTTDTPHS